MHMFVLSKMNHQAYLFRTFLSSVMYGKLLMDPSIDKIRLLHKICYHLLTLLGLTFPDIL